jgi:hypothetical protein
MLPAEFEPTTPDLERRQTDALDSAATGTGYDAVYFHVNLLLLRTDGRTSLHLS